MFKNLFLNYFANPSLYSGKMTLRMPDNTEIILGTGKGTTATLEIKDDSFYKYVVLYGDIGFGESYMYEYFTTPNILALLTWFIENKSHIPGMSESTSSKPGFELFKWVSKFTHAKRKNTKEMSKKNIAEHYDVSNDFYQLWLDETMTYSSALFTNESESLQQGQLNKYERICQEVELSSNMHILEIGSGWGGFAIYAASTYGCKITTVTISKEQFEFAQNRIKEQKLDHLIDIKFLDYRDITGQYDAVVSIEMVEALGYEHFDTYFTKCNQSLKIGGKFCLQCITFPDFMFDQYRKNVDFIQRHIFPGSLLMSTAAALNSVARTGTMQVRDIHCLGLSYARTLAQWRKTYNEQLDAIGELGFDEVEIRKWEYYFVYCEVGFTAKYIDDVQMTFEKI